MFGVWGPLRPFAMPDCDTKRRSVLVFLTLKEKNETYHIPQMCYRLLIMQRGYVCRWKQKEEPVSDWIKIQNQNINFQIFFLVGSRHLSPNIALPPLVDCGAGLYLRAEIEK